MEEIKITGMSDSQADLAYKSLERMIVTLVLEPGMVVNERSLIEATGMGRTPVREAIQRLAWEGFFEIRPRSGIAVTALEPQDFARVIDAREGLEVLLARDAARYAGAPDFERMKLASKQLKESVEINDAFLFLDADKIFDENLGRSAGNVFAARVVAPLQTHSRRFWYRLHRGQDAIRRSAAAHIELIDSIMSGDSDVAGNKARELMHHLREMMA
ncbi:MULTISPECIES: GntR family transcriptional regulator [unclassified Bartonella]|uniref:GntR family transcriptional regulator n=1 Tax=unclassified Bartonella TaxID=2645622 RepID=UPI0015F800D8|nr:MULTISPECIES: GntR family transcriptional regulator [unclassified Bartonella]UXN07664.1 GntR family transcriptional regulator [Bartonella sp. HY761]